MISASEQCDDLASQNEKSKNPNVSINSKIENLLAIILQIQTTMSLLDNLEIKIVEFVAKSRVFLATFLDQPVELLHHQAEAVTFILRKLLGCENWRGYGQSNAALIADKVIYSISCYVLCLSIQLFNHFDF